MPKNLLICDLLALYGPLLTEKQARLLELYYYDDLSLSEIAENEGGSRQGAMDVIKRAEKELLHAEETLHLHRRNILQAELLEQMHIALARQDTRLAEQLLTQLESTLED